MGHSWLLATADMMTNELDKTSRLKETSLCETVVELNTKRQNCLHAERGDACIVYLQHGLGRTLSRKTADQVITYTS